MGMRNIMEDDMQNSKTGPVESNTKYEAAAMDYRRPVNRLITVEPVIIMYNLAFFASTPLQIQYIHQRVKEDLAGGITNSTNTSSPDDCGGSSDTDDEVQAASAFYLTVLTMFAIIPCLFTTLLIGPYSDKAGRKYALIPAFCGEVFRIIVSITVIGLRLSLWFLAVGLLGQGLVGGAGAVLMTCYSYMADVTYVKQRAFRMFIIELCTGIGQAGAQIIIGQAIKALGYFWPYVAILVIQMCSLMYIIFILPESRVKQPDATLFTTMNYKRAARLYFGSYMKGKRLSLGLGLSVLGMMAAINMVNNETILLYLVSKPLCWGPALVGFFNGTSMIVKLVGSFIVLKLLIGRLPEAMLAIGSLVSFAGSALVVGLATQTWIMFLAPVVGFSSQLADAMIRSITSKLAGRENQGALFASQAWMAFFSAMIGVLFFNSIYAESTDFHGLVFILAAALYIFPITFVLLLYLREKKRSPEISITVAETTEDATTTGIDNQVWDTAISERELSPEVPTNTRL